MVFVLFASSDNAIYLYKVLSKNLIGFFELQTVGSTLGWL